MPTKPPRMQVAKLFQNGRSQAVRLPAEFRFEGNEVFVRRDEATGDVVLSRRPGGWSEFFAQAKQTPEASDFLLERVDPPPQSREDLWCGATCSIPTS